MKISVVVPVYNSEAYLPDLLTSLINQTLSDIEIIFVDDASTDRSLSIIETYQKMYPNQIRVFKNAVNLGQGACRNIGLKQATGEYISFVDSDDYLHPYMYHDMYEGAITYHKPNIITTGIVFAKEDSTFQDYYPSYRYGGRVYHTLEMPKSILEESPSCGNKLFKREFLEGSSFLEHTMWEDVAFSYSHLFLTNQVLRFTNPDYYYRKHDNIGVSAKGFQVNPKILDIFQVADEIGEKAKVKGRIQMFKKEIETVQVIACLHRIREVLDWEIDYEAKKELCQNLYSIIKEKYALIEDIWQDILNMRVDYLTIKQVLAFGNSDSSLKQSIQNVDRLIRTLRH